MTAPGEEPSTHEQGLLLRVLSALHREDVVGLRSGTTVLDGPDGAWLRLATGPDDALLLPVTDDGFQARSRARLPLLRQERRARDLTTLDEVLGALAALADPEDLAGFAAYSEECREALATVTLQEEVRPDLLRRLTRRYGTDAARWTGLADGLAHDALAALHDHPVYPTSRRRAGISPRCARTFAPEYHQRFRLRWLLLPRDSVTSTAATTGRALPGLPTPAELGHEVLDDSHVALPVHPLSLGEPVEAALRETGLRSRAHLATRPALDVLPTLSMRTLALVDRPTHHVKVPLCTSTLGQRNRRTIKPGTLRDGAAAERLLRSVLAREPRLVERVLLTDESCHADAGHEVLAVLLRRYPDGLDDAAVVPLAALLARGPDDRLQVEHLADRFYGGDPLALLDGLLRLLFDLQVTLYGYGIALESHQQNLSLVLSSDAPPRLLLKDNDGLRINLGRLHSRGLDAEGFDDVRIVTADDDALADVFITITLHLCAGAFAFGLAHRGTAPLDDLRAMVRDLLAEALARPGTDHLRRRCLQSAALPVKAMVSAGTLLSKDRSGAADVNKHYTSGPNYLRGPDR